MPLTEKDNPFHIFIALLLHSVCAHLTRVKQAQRTKLAEYNKVCIRCALCVSWDWFGDNKTQVSVPHC